MTPRALVAALALSLTPGAVHAIPATRPARPAVRPPARRVAPIVRHGPRVELWYRYLSLSIPGGSGDTHGGGIAVLPLQPLRGARWFRWSLGAEMLDRSGPNDHHDAFVLSTMSVGLQVPVGRFTGFAAVTGAAGYAWMNRFEHTDGRFVYAVGGELGGAWRIAGFFGLGLAVGFARTVEGSIYHDGASLRLMVTLH